MIPILSAKIEDAIKEAKSLPKSRETALVVTKLEEALHWYQAFLQVPVYMPAQQHAGSPGSPDSPAA